MSEGYRITEVPVTGTIVMNDGRVLGIDSKFIDGNESRFIVYNPRTKEVDNVLGPATNGFWSSDELYEIPRALSDKGGLFVGDFLKIKEGVPSGYKIEEFDAVTGALKCEIEISAFIEGDWFDQYRIADVVRVNNKCVLIACYIDDRHTSSGLEFFSYYQDDDEMYSINTLHSDEYEDYVYYGAAFSRKGTELTCRRTDDGTVLFYPETPDSWENVTVAFSDEWQSCEFSITWPLEEDPERFDMLTEGTLDIDCKEGSVIKSGFFRASNSYGKAVLIDEIIEKGEDYYYFTIRPLRLLLVEITKKHETHVYLLGRYFMKWQLGGSWAAPGEEAFKYKYDINTRTAIIETAKKSILISKR